MRQRKTLNKPLLRKLALKLRRLRHEEHYNQGEWGRKTACGTVACLAGHAVMLAGYKLKFEAPVGDSIPPIAFECAKDGRAPKPVAVVAGAELGVSKDSYLFSGGAYGWPEPYQRRFVAAVYGQQSGERPSRIAADLLDAIADGTVKL